MVQLTRPSWWINMLITTFMTMVFIYIIKKALNKVPVPVVSDIANAV
jgi:hypothetical protein